MIPFLAPFGLSSGLMMMSRPAAGSIRQHLYVVDDVANRVVEFPLRADGLPSTKPDNVLQIDGVPQGLAFDSAGYLYVTVFSNSKATGSVEIFRPGATGSQRPARSITFKDYADPVFVAIDPMDNVYIDLSNYTIDIYAAKNTKRLIATIEIPDLINDMIIDRSGTLFVSELDQIGVYQDPLRRQQPDGLVLPQGGFEFAILGSIAVDESDGRLFFKSYPFAQQPWGDFDFAVRTLPGYHRTGVSADPVLQSRACIGPENGIGISYGAAVSGRYFMAGCVGSAPGNVLVFYKDAYGKRSPVEHVGQSYVQSVASIKIGP